MAVGFRRKTVIRVKDLNLRLTDQEKKIARIIRQDCEVYKPHNARGKLGPVFIVSEAYICQYLKGYKDMVTKICESMYGENTGVFLCEHTGTLKVVATNQ